MQALNKVMLYSVKGVELLSKLGSDKNHSGEVPSGKPSSGKATLEDASSSWGRTRKEAALKADLFAGPDKIVSAGNTYGLIKLTIHEAKVKSEQRYCAVVSIGMQTYMSRTEPKATCSPVFEEGHNLVLQRDGATRAHIALYSTDRPIRGQFRKTLCGWCDINLAAFFGPGGADRVRDGWYPLLDPSNSAKEAGQVRISTEAATLEHLAQQFWHRILAMADVRDDQQLTLNEFQALMQALDGDMSHEEVEELFHSAGEKSNGHVSVGSLANSLQQYQLLGGLFKIIKRCPVSGADLIPGKDLENIIYMTLCMDEGTCQSLQGGFSTAEQATQSWMLKLSEWATQPLAGSWGHKYQAGGLNIGGKSVRILAYDQHEHRQGLEFLLHPGKLPSEYAGAKSAHILVYDRREQRVVEETISPYMVLAMRNMYQTPVGRLMMGSGAHRALLDLTRREGRYMNSPASIKEIDKFLRTFGGQLDASDTAEPIESFNTFNQFFYRKLRPSARPIAEPKHGHVVVSACDARLTAFYGLSDATRCWVKGRQFSLAGLLADNSKDQHVASQFDDGCMMIFRLAPQDYHRFHFLTGATLTSITNVPGRLYTVNPIAINSPFANVLTQNKRAICMYDTPEYGPVAFVVIGATMVGSIQFTAEVGCAYEKGDELGYFAFGGSTCIAIFQKDAVVVDEDIISNSLKSLETLVRMGERIAVKPGSHFERTSSQKQQLALLTEKSTIGISLFQDVASQDSALLGASDSQHSCGSSHDKLLGAEVAPGATHPSHSASQEAVDSGAVLATGNEGSDSHAEEAMNHQGGVDDDGQHPIADMTGPGTCAAQSTPSVSSSDKLQESQTQGSRGEQALLADIPPPQHEVSIKHHVSNDGISHFDDDDDAPSQERQPDAPAHASEAHYKLVGHGSMSPFQASLPAGVSMTNDSSQ